MAKQGAMHGIAVGGCCELSTSAHHLVAKIGEEQGYRLAESSGMDIEDAITIATRLLKGRIAKQVWRDYHKHAFARRCYADPSDMGLKALQLAGMRREQDQTEREQLQLQHTLLTRLCRSDPFGGLSDSLSPVAIAAGDRRCDRGEACERQAAQAG